MTDRPDPLDDLGGLPPDVPATWKPGIRDELDDATRARQPEPLTAESLWNQTWYAVPDDESGGFAVATCDQPTSQIDPLRTRDRVLLWVTWEQHAAWIVRLHNRSLPEAHVCDDRNADGTDGTCHLDGTHGGPCQECGNEARTCAHQPPWAEMLLCGNLKCKIHTG